MYTPISIMVAPMDHASFLSEATLTEVGVYINILPIHTYWYILITCTYSKLLIIKILENLKHEASVFY